MEKLRSLLELIDLGVKVTIAVMAFFLFGVQKGQLDIDKRKLERQQGRGGIV